MTTEAFNAFLIAQDKRDRATDSAIAELREDLAMMHRSRHETQENLSIALGELRVDSANTEKNLNELTALVKELVQAMKGNSFGGDGVLSRLEELRTDVDEITDRINTVEHQAKGIRWFVSAVAALIAVLVSFKDLIK